MFSFVNFRLGVGCLIWTTTIDRSMPLMKLVFTIFALFLEIFYSPPPIINTILQNFVMRLVTQEFVLRPQPLLLKSDKIVLVCYASQCLFFTDGKYAFKDRVRQSCWKFHASR